MLQPDVTIKWSQAQIGGTLRSPTNALVTPSTHRLCYGLRAAGVNGLQHFLEVQQSTGHWRTHAHIAPVPAPVLDHKFLPFVLRHASAGILAEP